MERCVNEPKDAYPTPLFLTQPNTNTLPLARIQKGPIPSEVTSEN